MTANSLAPWELRIGDHRVFYGYQAAEFVTKLKELLEQPLSLLS